MGFVLMYFIFTINRRYDSTTFLVKKGSSVPFKRGRVKGKKICNVDVEGQEIFYEEGWGSGLY